MNRQERKGLILLVYLLIAMTIFIYHDYLIGNSLLFINSVDTTINFLPNIINLHNIIYSGEFPMWSFAKGLGANVTTGNPTYLGDIFSLIIILLPKTFYSICS